MHTIEYPIPSLTLTLKERAVNILKELFSKVGYLGALRHEITDRPTTWWIGKHFNWGMGIRNYLRDKGILDEELPTGNWDDYYVECIEEAVRQLE